MTVCEVVNSSVLVGLGGGGEWSKGKVEVKGVGDVPSRKGVYSI